MAKHETPITLTDEHLRLKACVLWALKDHIADELRYEVDPEHKRDCWWVFDDEAFEEIIHQIDEELSILMLQAHAEEAKGLEPRLA